MLRMISKVVTSIVHIMLKKKRKALYLAKVKLAGGGSLGIRKKTSVVASITNGKVRPSAKKMRYPVPRTSMVIVSLICTSSVR